MFFEDLLNKLLGFLSPLWFSSDLSPIIGHAGHWLTDSLPFCKLDCEFGWARTLPSPVSKGYLPSQISSPSSSPLSDRSPFPSSPPSVPSPPGPVVVVNGVVVVVVVVVLYVVIDVVAVVFVVVDHPQGPASCKWFSGGTSLLHIIIQWGRPLANDHLEGPASRRWSSVTSVTQSCGPF